MTENKRDYVASPKRRVAPVEHGTYAAYVHAKCRCPACVDTNTITVAAQRQHRLGTEPSQHGREGYNNYGCRCDVCRDANAEYFRAYRARRKATT